MQQGTSTLLGRYRVLSTSTAGGFGTVSICWDTRLQRRVAIKRMPLRLGEDSPARASTVDEALSEARTSSLLAHPNIVRVYDFESDERYSYLVMEHVDGLNLAELLARVEDGVLTFDECAHLIDSLASALAYAHENGVLHLDIKPANIMIDRSGIVKLADFGMASLASAAGFEGARGGTVGYMPPEQIEGGLVDERTDVFSLAVVVWQSLMGSNPYVADTPEKSANLIRRGPSPTLSRVEPSLAGVVEDTLLQALDPSPRARMSSVDAFARDIVDALGDVEEGRESLSDLIAQADEEDATSTSAGAVRARLPFLVRFPWLPGLFVRGIAAATCGWVCYHALAYLFPGSSNAQIFGTAGAAVATAAWPPLGGAFATAALAVPCTFPPSMWGFPMALCVGTIGLIWWVAVGRFEYLAGSALLLPSCLSSPLAGVGLSGFCLPPMSAFSTGMLSMLTYRFFATAMAQGFFAETLLDTLKAEALQPSTWVLAAGCGVAAMLCAIIAQRETVVSHVVGQLVAVAALVVAYIVCGYMENGGFGSALDGPAIGIAVILGATLCIAKILLGDGTRG